MREHNDARKKLLTSGTLIASLSAVTGCSSPTLPTYDTVRAETEAAIQRIADELPAGARFSPRPEGSPYGCDSGGVMYTGQWDMYPAPGFDGGRFIETLPDQLGDGFTVEELGFDPGFPALGLIADAYGGTGINVSVGSIDGADVVGITALSRCAQPPE
ncbi:hypothetical protein [Microbacterium arborescens]|uniref:hypothetical protein n=1 Tax=Microbacterium arborescens TaxID=33883 RepID=UPI002785E12A|nr:hypothetical protein [Microbacterium arborescens]MDQ1218434.1 hypothetical protein [Microbacterium arborescens]